MSSTLTMCIHSGSEDRRKGFRLQFNYDIDLIERLKRAVPHTEREWYPDIKTWWVSENYETVLTEMFSNFHALIHLQGHLFEK